MPTTLSDGRIRVDSGDTLYGIYGANWKQASGYTGDPTKLAIGTVLPAKGGTTPAPAAATASAQPSAPTQAPDQGTPPAQGGSLGTGANSYQQYLDIAKAQNASLAKTQEDAINQASAIQQQSYQDLANKTRSQEPLVRAVYSDLAKEFQLGEQTELNTATEVGNANIGTARAANASAGLDIGTGSLVSNVGQAQVEKEANIKQVANSYQIKYTQLADQLNKSVGDLEKEAAGYEASGNNVVAAKITQIAENKQKYDELSIKQADAMQSADNEAQKLAITQAYDAARIQIEQQNVQLAAQRVAIEARNSDISAARLGIEAKNAQTNSDLKDIQLLQAKSGLLKNADITITNTDGIQAKDANGNAVSLAQALQLRGTNPGDIPNQIITYLAQSPTQSDQVKGDAIKKQVSGLVKLGLSDAKISDALSKGWPELFGG